MSPTLTEKAPIVVKTEALIALTDRFCDAHLNEEYKRLCEALIRKMARKRVFPFMSGRLESWAVGVVHALGIINFLSDRSSEPHLPSPAIADGFGVGPSTMQQKSKAIRGMFKLFYFDREFSTRQNAARDPLANLLAIDGLIVDARTLPPKWQALLRDQELIP